MGKKYIVELKKNETLYKAATRESDGTAYVCSAIGTPYTEPDLEQVRKEAYDKGYQDANVKISSNEQAIAEKAYQRGLIDAWEAARKIAYMYSEERKKVFGENLIRKIQNIYSASEAIEKIRQYEQKQEEQSVTAEDVMRQYLDRFCKGKSCTGCPLHTPDFICGRGYHFLTNRHISDEEVRRAYATVLAKMKENNDNK